MISTAYKFIFLHVPKTSGNSLHTALEPFSDDRRVVRRGAQDGINRFEVRGPLTPRKHAMLEDYARVLGDRLAGFAVAIGVRHPFERIVSLYFSPHRWMVADDAGQWTLQEPHWDADAFRKLMRDTRSQADFLKVDGAVRRPDHVIRFEDLAATFDRFTGALGIPCSSAALPHVNRSAAPADLRAEVLADRQLAGEASERYAEDFALFGYPVGEAPGTG